MKLIGRTGRIAGTDVAVSDLLRIGAAPDNDFRVMVSGVSRHHARIVKQGDSYWVEDAGSTNGTFLNGLRIARERLRHLDVITLGRDVDLITVATDQPDAAPALTKAVEDAWLEPTEAQQGGARIELPAGETTLGRLAPANCILESPVIGRLHARITRTADHVVVEDVGSVNGTFVNGTRISGPTVLVDGDAISIAGVRHFRAHVVGNARRQEGQQVVATQTQVFDADWKTRLVWSAEELVELERERQRIVDAVRKQQGPAAAPAAPVTTKPASGAAVARPAPAPSKAAPVGAKPAATPPSPVSPAGPPVPPVVRAEKPSPAPPPAKPEEKPQAPRPEMPKPAPAKPEEPKPAPPKPEAPTPEPPRPPAPPAVKVAPEEMPTRPPARNDAASLKSMAPTVVGPRVRAVKLTGEKGAFQLEQGRHTIGRAENAAVPVLDPQVSRTHAVMTIASTEARVEDGGSSNGTFVNDVRVPAGGTALKTGDKLRFGGVEFTVEVV